MALSATFALTACGDGIGGSRPQAAAIATVSLPATTVTVTATSTVTATRQVTVAAAITAKPEAPAPGATDSAATPSVGIVEKFDEKWALKKSQDIIRDVRNVDEYMKDGIAVGIALSTLSTSYGRLADEGTPPGVNPADYQARLQTLQSFAEIAAEEYVDQPMEATARYAVIRKEPASCSSRSTARLARTSSSPSEHRRGMLPAHTEQRSRPDREHRLRPSSSAP